MNGKFRVLGDSRGIPMDGPFVSPPAGGGVEIVLFPEMGQEQYFRENWGSNVIDVWVT